MASLWERQRDACNGPLQHVRAGKCWALEVPEVAERQPAGQARPSSDCVYDNIAWFREPNEWGDLTGVSCCDSAVAEVIQVCLLGTSMQGATVIYWDK